MKALFPQGLELPLGSTYMHEKVKHLEQSSDKQ